MTKRIAVVDGDKAARDEIQALLSPRGWAVEAFATISAAFAQLVTDPPNLLLVEVDLEDGCGLNLIDLVKAPAIVVSSRADETDVVRGYAAGAVDYITKPFRPDELVAKCRVHLSRSSRIEPPSEHTPEVPTVEGLAFGRYRLIRALGRGGYGVVYLAEDTEKKVVVAIKVSTPPEDDKQAHARFVRETHALSGLNSRHLARIVDVGFMGQRVYYAMEYVGGLSLHRHVSQNGPMSEAEVRPIAMSLFRAIETISTAGLVHRDVKPSNVILRDGFLHDAVLVDFGLAKNSRDKELTNSSSDLLLGTPAYMPPEVIRGHVDHDVRSDLWSVGLTLRYALMGHEPFPDLQGFRLLDAVANHTPMPSITAVVSPGFGKLLAALCSYDLTARPQTPQDAILALELIQEREPPSNDRLSLPGATKPSKKPPGAS